ncbi:MAG: hypothetical protein IJM57_01845, partial [Lachnospiraceae bacterium]|nr:hypothetical protein [Lachnospiraceae bacterium]
MERVKSKITVIILFFVALAVGLGGGAVLFFAMIKDFDPAIRHFDYGSLFALIAASACGAGAALAIAGAFAVSKKVTFNPEGAKSSFVGIFSSVLAGLMCVLYFGSGVKAGIPEEKPGILLAELTFVVLSAVFFFLKASGLFSKKPMIA